MLPKPGRRAPRRHLTALAALLALTGPLAQAGVLRIDNATPHRLEVQVAGAPVGTVVPGVPAEVPVAFPEAGYLAVTVRVPIGGGRSHPVELPSIRPTLENAEQHKPHFMTVEVDTLVCVAVLDPQSECCTWTLTGRLRALEPQAARAAQVRGGSSGDGANLPAGQVQVPRNPASLPALHTSAAQPASAAAVPVSPSAPLPPVPMPPLGRTGARSPAPAASGRALRRPVPTRPEQNRPAVQAPAVPLPVLARPVQAALSAPLGDLVDASIMTRFYQAAPGLPRRSDSRAQAARALLARTDLDPATLTQVPRATKRWQEAAVTVQKAMRKARTWDAFMGRARDLLQGAPPVTRAAQAAAAAGLLAPPPLPAPAPGWAGAPAPATPSLGNPSQATPHPAPSASSPASLAPPLNLPFLEGALHPAAAELSPYGLLLGQDPDLALPAGPSLSPALPWLQAPGWGTAWTPSPRSPANLPRAQAPSLAPESPINLPSLPRLDGEFSPTFGGAATPPGF